VQGKKELACGERGGGAAVLHLILAGADWGLQSCYDRFVGLRTDASGKFSCWCSDSGG
jgi:hypothetical protein